MKRNHFFGKYYKFVSEDGFSFAIIVARSNEGRHIQLITKEKAYYNISLDDIRINSSCFKASVETEELSFKGDLRIQGKHPLSRYAMGPFRHFPLECKHNIYSMYHEVIGTITINGISHHMKYGYIEGDEGKNFPKRYIWYNSVSEDSGVTFAIASIPFGPITFTGVLCFVSHLGDEYYLCTYNFARAKILNPGHIIITKGKTKLEVTIDKEHTGHDLKAPIKGKMDRYIKENIAIPSHYTLTVGDDIILNKDDSVSSYEYMWEES